MSSLRVEVMMLLELAERCEQSAGADRETDVLIHEALTNWQPQQRVMYYGKPTGEHVDQIEGHFIKSPEYTRSLDAAITLVPAGWVGLVGLGPDGPVGACLQNRDDDPTREVEADAQSPALALCAAALRARAAVTPLGE